MNNKRQILFNLLVPVQITVASYTLYIIFTQKLVQKGKP